MFDIIIHKCEKSTVCYVSPARNSAMAVCISFVCCASLPYMSIVAEFNVNMSFSACQIADMLLSEEEPVSAVSKTAKQDRGRFVPNGRLVYCLIDMDPVFRKFVEYFKSGLIKRGIYLFE